MSRLSRARKKILTHVRHLLYAFYKLPPLKKMISGGITAMKIGTSIKLIISVIGIIVIGFIGFRVVIHQNPSIVEESQINKPEQAITNAKIIRQPTQKEIKTKREISNTENIEVRQSFTPKEVPTVQSNDGEIKKFSTWLSNRNEGETLEQAKSLDSRQNFDIDQEKKQIQSVIFDQWKKGYETYEVEKYMSAIWEDDFFYISDKGTPDNISDDIIFRGGQKERESAKLVFRNFPKRIELNLVPQSDIEFLSDNIAVAKYDYEIKFSRVPTPDYDLEMVYSSGDMIIILEHRASSKDKSEWRILEWYDHAK
jgi:hypothetical protein